MSGELRDVYVASKRFYEDQAVNFTADVNDVFQHVFARGCYVEMTNTLELAEVDGGEGHLVLVYWVGFDEDEHTWEPVADIWRSAPDFPRKN